MKHLRNTILRHHVSSTLNSPLYDFLIFKKSLNILNEAEIEKALLILKKKKTLLSYKRSSSVTLIN